MKILAAFFSLFTLNAACCFAAIKGYDALSYRPAADDSNFFSLWETTPLQSRQNILGISAQVAYKALQFSANDSAARDIVQSYQMNHVYFSRGIFTGWLSLGFDLPFGVTRVLKPASLNNSPSSQSVLGDPRFYAKTQFPDFMKNQFFNLGLLSYLDVPAGYSEYFVGNSGLSGGGELLFEFKPSRRFTILFNTGPRFQKTYRLTDYLVGNRLNYGLGFFFGATKHLGLVTELKGSSKLSKPLMEVTSQPAELLLGGRYSFGTTGIELGLAASAALVRGQDAPNWRAVLDLRMNF